jgi:elongation factor Ts
MQAIKELRETSGAGMLDCKKALTETNGDLEAAKDWLRKKGLAKAAKKADRVAAEGLVAMKIEGNKGTVVEVNSETDFVAKNEQFQKFVSEVANCAFDKDGDIEAIKAEKETAIAENTASIGEKLEIRRAAKLEADVVTGYIHTATAEGMGKIAVLVGVNGAAADKADEIKKIAMHVAAANPISATIAEVPAENVERERAIFKEQAIASGKPAEIAEKMVEGRIRKFYEEVVLEEQTFVMDTNKKIKDVIKELGPEAKLVGFVKFTLGEGIEKKVDNFQEEVMQQAGL